MLTKTSPNFSSRRNSVIATVIHYTGGGRASGSVNWLCDPRSKASAHYVISRSGETTELVAPAHKAWHAGVSETVIDGVCLSDANDFSIGVELANHGLLYRDESGVFWWTLGRELRRYRRDEPMFGTLRWDTGHEVEGWWEPYPEEQIKALESLLEYLDDLGYASAVNSLIGHEEIAVPLGRKIDPGPLFPWDRFSRSTVRRTQGR